MTDERAQLEAKLDRLMDKVDRDGWTPPHFAARAAITRRLVEIDSAEEVPARPQN